MKQTLQLSGTENVWLMDDGTLQIFGQKIAETELETAPETVGIQYPSEFVCLLMNFLNEHYTMFFNDDIPTLDNADDYDDEDDYFTNDEVNYD